MTDEKNGMAKVQGIVRKLKENQDAIFIGRVPPQTKELFERLAHDEFCDDFGFALKWLIERAFDNDVRDARIDDLQEQIESIKDVLSQQSEQPTVKKMVDGTTRKVKQ